MNTKFPPNVKKLAKETVEDITFGLPGMKKHFKILPKGSAEQIDFEKIQNAAVRLTQKIGDAEKIRNAHDTKDTEDEARVEISQIKNRKIAQEKEIESKYKDLIALKEQELRDLREEREEKIRENRMNHQKAEDNVRAVRDGKIEKDSRKIVAAKENMWSQREDSRVLFLKAVNLFESALLGREGGEEVLREIVRG
jgi:alpha-N-acetylglucosamine transferase